MNYNRYNPGQSESLGIIVRKKNQVKHNKCTA